MLTAEIKVNGCLILHVYVHNTGEMVGNGYRYEWHVYDVGKAQVIDRGTVYHELADGAYALIAKVLGELE